MTNVFFFNINKGAFFFSCTTATMKMFFNFFFPLSGMKIAFLLTLMVFQSGLKAEYKSQFSYKLQIET